MAAQSSVDSCAAMPGGGRCGVPRPLRCERSALPLRQPPALEKLCQKRGCLSKSTGHYPQTPMPGIAKTIQPPDDV